MAGEVKRNRSRAWRIAAAALLLGGAATALPLATHAARPLAAQPELSTRAKPILSIDGLRFRDLNANGALDPYEDWRLPVAQRVDDLLARMTLREKSGLMLIDTLNAACGGAIPAKGFDYIHNQNMRRFMFRNLVSQTPSCAADKGFRAGSTVTPGQAAGFINSVQFLAESSRLGIPAMFKSNARNHIDKEAKAGINESAGSFTAFPKEAGLAAAALGEGYRKTGKTGVIDPQLIRDFSQVMGEEWRAIGLRGMYGYMADLGTEPRWHRFHETFSENADVTAGIMRELVLGLQGGPVSPSSNVALTIKHFPGGGPQQFGLDPHYAMGKNQVYPAHRFGDHLKPFRAAIDAGVGAIMPYYGVPVDLEYEGVRYNSVGMAFSPQIVTDLLRGKLGFTGYVNSDTGIINDRAWGLEDKTVPERVAAAINSGTDILSGFDSVQTILDLVDKKLITEARVDLAARRLLVELFALGLFENPYVDEAKAGDIIGSDAHRALAMDIQRKSIVLLQNQQSLLPLKPASKLYVVGMPTTAFTDLKFTATDGSPDKGTRPSAAGHDYAVIRVEVHVSGSDYRSDDPATGMNPAYRDPTTGKPWGAQDRCVAKNEKPCTDDGLIFGGAYPWEADNLAFSAMHGSWTMSPSLDEIRAIMAEVGPGKTILAIDFRQPYVIDQESGMRGAGAILATFGVSDLALAEVLQGTFRPQGRMPYALAGNLRAIRENDPDAPGYQPKDTLFPFAFGLTYR